MKFCVLPYSIFGGLCLRSAEVKRNCRHRRSTDGQSRNIRHDLTPEIRCMRNECIDKGNEAKGLSFRNVESTRGSEPGLRPEH